MSPAFSSAGSSNLTHSSGKEAFLKAIKYDSIAAILRQYDNQMSSTSSKPLSSMSGKMSEPQRHTRSRKNKLSPEELADFKAKSQCKSCRMFGNRASEHSSDRSLPATSKSTKRSATSDDRRDQDNSKQAFKLDMANLSFTPSDSPLDVCHITDISHGALLKDGEPYAAI